MSAKLLLHARREPPDPESVALAQKKRGFRKVVFRSDLLHPRIRDRVIEQADGRRIAGKRRVRKRVDDILLHCAPPFGTRSMIAYSENVPVLNGIAQPDSPDVTMNVVSPRTDKP